MKPLTLEEYERILHPENYWQIRCELAEKCLGESPCDPDVTKEQINAHKEYNEFLTKYGKV